jgi:hypothetical protein
VLQYSRSAFLPQLVWLLAAAVRDTATAQLAALSEGVPLLLGRILDAASVMGSGSAEVVAAADQIEESDVPGDVAELKIACCGALEALLAGCTAVQVCIHSLSPIGEHCDRLPSVLPKQAPPIRGELLYPRGELLYPWKLVPGHAPNQNTCILIILITSPYSLTAGIVLICFSQLAP